MKTVLTLLICWSTCAFAQTNDTEQIKSVVERTFHAMKTADSVLLKSCFTNSATLFIAKTVQDSTSVRTVPVANFIQNVLKQKAGSLDERVTSWGPITVDKDLATAWVPYVFYLQGTYTHKGVDAFTFVKMQGVWKIQTLMYTMYP